MVDRMAEEADAHKMAFDKRLRHVETMSNALSMHLLGLEVLMSHGEVYVLPATSISRSIAETAASCAWILNADDPDTRTARAYAALLHDLDSSVGTVSLVPTSSKRIADIRERVISELGKRGGRVQRVIKDGKETADVNVVGLRRAHAKVRFHHSHRVKTETPAIGGLYSAMSGAVHGEQIHLDMALDDPAMFARLIALVAIRSTETWSNAVHRWVGAIPPPFYAAADYQQLRNAIPQHLREEFEAGAR